MEWKKVVAVLIQMPSSRCKCWMQMTVGREGGRKWFAHGYGSRSVISWQTRVDSATLCTAHGARAFLLIHETEPPWRAVFKLAWRRNAFLGSDGGARRLDIDGYTCIRIESRGVLRVLSAFGRSRCRKDSSDFNGRSTDIFGTAVSKNDKSSHRRIRYICSRTRTRCR